MPSSIGKAESWRGHDPVFGQLSSNHAEVIEQWGRCAAYHGPLLQSWATYDGFLMYIVVALEEDRRKVEAPCY